MTTPGPWHVEGPDDEPYGDIRVVGPYGSICKFWQDDVALDANPEQWANARLAAAAPDLLTACMQAAVCLPAGPVLQSVMEAIAKAEGR